MAQHRSRDQQADPAASRSNATFAPPHLLRSAERAALLGFKPATVWLTGLSGAGKSTIASHVEVALLRDGMPAVVIDGDVLRRTVCTDLGFSPADRTENVRRAAAIARLVNEAGLIAIVALISPSSIDRRMARSMVAPHCFLEVYLSAPLAVCAGRDPKGLYARAFAGEIGNFTGVSAPYEVPDGPDLELDTGRHPIEHCSQAVRDLVVHACRQS